MPYVFNPFTGSFDDTVPLSGGKIPANYLPSYVDDVVEVANLAALPVTGEAGKIYITLDDNNTYRWSGSQYVLVGPEPPVVSVNGETGAVSLNVDDLDNYNLRLLPDATSGRWNSRIYSSAPTNGQFRVISNRNVMIPFIDSLGNNLTSNFTSVFSNYFATPTVWLSTDGITWSQRVSQYSSINASPNYLNLQITADFSFGSTLFFATVDPTAGPATYPLANKNLLSYNSATAKWEPTPINLSYVSDVDVTTTAPTNGQSLTWNGSKFVPTTVVRPTDSINVLADVDTATAAPTNGQALIWNSTLNSFAPNTVVSSSTLGITGASAITNCISLSQANYDAIAVKDPNTLYVIV